MNIIIESAMPDGTPVQIEDWHMDYRFMAPGSLVVAYPTGTKDSGRPFGPRRGEAFRLEMSFDSHIEAREAFKRLLAGDARLVDYRENVEAKYRDFIPE